MSTPSSSSSNADIMITAAAKYLSWRQATNFVFRDGHAVGVPSITLRHEICIWHLVDFATDLVKKHLQGPSPAEVAIANLPIVLHFIATPVMNWWDPPSPTQEMLSRLPSPLVALARDALEPEQFFSADFDWNGRVKAQEAAIVAREEHDEDFYDLLKSTIPDNSIKPNNEVSLREWNELCQQAATDDVAERVVRLIVESLAAAPALLLSPTSGPGVIVRQFRDIYNFPTAILPIRDWAHTMVEEQKAGEADPLQVFGRALLARKGDKA